MGLLFARFGESRHLRFAAAYSAAALLAGLIACGGGGGTEGAATTPTGEPVSPSGSVQPGEIPPVLLLAEPRAVIQTSSYALAWSSEGAFGGSIVAQVEQLPGFTPAAAFTLQSNGPAATFGDHRLRYADGFFVLAAAVDNSAVQSQPLGVDLYPPDVPRVPPSLPPCRGNDTQPCSNSLGFVNAFDWPTRAGDEVSVVIPRADPAMLTYNVLIKVNAGADLHAIITGAGGQSVEVPRGQSWRYDFPSATVRVQGCNTAGECVESAERALQTALINGVVELAPRGSAPASTEFQNLTRERVVVKESVPGGEARLRIYSRRDEEDRWSPLALVTSTAPGFGRRFAFSADGLTLAVEASPCAAVTVVCNDSTVFVYHSGTAVTAYEEQARFIGMRAPQLSFDGNRMAGIAIAAQRGGDAILGFVRDGVAWRQLPMPAIDYTPLDIALSGFGHTIAVARQGTHDNPCGCRAVVVYEGGNPEAWHEVAVLHSNKRLDTVGSPNDDGFGFVSGHTRSLALKFDGSRVAVGASLDSSDASDTVGDPANRNAPNSGAIYLFQREAGNTFVRQAFIKPRAAAPLDRFGHEVLLSGALFGAARGLAANAPGVNRNQAADHALPSPTPGPSGTLTGAAAYVFEEQGAAWVERATIVAPNAAEADFNASHLVVGAAVGFDTGVAAAAGGVVRRAFTY